VIRQYDWPSYIPWPNDPWIYIDREVQGYFSEYGYNDYVDVPTALRIKIVKRVDNDVIARLRYALDQGETFSGAQIVVKYNASVQLITPRYLGQLIDFILTGPQGSEHVIWIELSPDVYETYVQFDSHNIYLVTYIAYEHGSETLEDTIGWNDKYIFSTSISNAPLVNFSLSFEIA
jgi:hypothetical protein